MTKKLLIGLACFAVGLFVAKYAVEDRIKAWYADTYIPRPTPAPATALPSQICLTWSDDPRTTQAVQWSVLPVATEGWVEYGVEESTQRVAATATDLEDKLINNDPLNRRYSATLTGLQPATQYKYRVGNDTQGWSGWAPFTTAPDGPAPYSFVYMGDPQIGFEFWKGLIHKAQERLPNAALYLTAGDLVNRGKYRDEWDVFFNAGEGIFDRITQVPVLGNHDYSSLPSPDFYLKLFTLPENGPKTLPAEHAYSFKYGNALFIVLDSNRAPEEQSAWLEDQLKNTDAVWKFASYHHPAYSSSANRNNPEIRRVWGDLFDKYHLDIAFQGHDHAYLRSFPMKAQKPVQSFADGTVYLVAVSGTKFYEQGAYDYTAKGFVKTSTYQVIDIETTPKNKLSYRSYDIDGNVKDEFVIEK